MSRDTEAIGQESEAPLRCATGREPSQGRQLRSPEEAKRRVYTPRQRLMLLDTWRRSGLPALDFASLVGISKHTLYGPFQKNRNTRPNRERGRSSPTDRHFPSLACASG